MVEAQPQRYDYLVMEEFHYNQTILSNKSRLNFSQAKILLSALTALIEKSLKEMATKSCI